MSDHPIPPTASGADLARQALAAARAKAKNTPPPGAKKPRRTIRPARGEGRDPQGFGSILGRLTAEQGWNDQLGGGNIIDRWTELCPTVYADTTRPTGYDPDTGTLTIRAASHTIATGLRMAEPLLVTTVNDKMRRRVVRRIRVTIGTDAATAPELGERVPAVQPRTEAPVRTRADGCPGYQATLEAALAHRPEREPANPYVREALERQAAALRANRQPESEHRDAYWELDRLKSAEVDRNEAVRRAAIARKRAEQAGRGQLPRRAFDVA